MATKKTTHSKSKIAKKPAKKATKPVKSAKKVIAKKQAKSKPIAKKAAPKATKSTKSVKKAVVKKPAKIVVKKATKTKPIAKKTVLKTAPLAKAVKKPIIQTVNTTKPSSTKSNVYNTVSKKTTVPTITKKPIVIPKTSVRTSVKYTPDFTKSILDTSEQNQSGNMVRYSDAELAEFKELITQKLEPARKELAYLQGLITRKDEMGGDETENRYMTMEDGSMSMEREQLSQMASRQITFIDHLEKALARIENKTYGICRVTGKLIDKARLRAVPHATLSMEAKMSSLK